MEAWYQATASFSAAAGANTSINATVAMTTGDSQTIYAKFTFRQGSTAKQTTKDGYLYYVNASNVVFRVSSQPTLAAGTHYGTATFDGVTYWHDSACTTNQLTNDEKAHITAGSLTVSVAGDTRTRVAKAAPVAVGAKFYNAVDAVSEPGFGTTLGNAVSFTAAIAEGGDVTGVGTVYYAVNGTGTELIDDATMVSNYVGTTQASWNDGDGTAPITQTLTVSASA